MYLNKFILLVGLTIVFSGCNNSLHIVFPENMQNQINQAVQKYNYLLFIYIDVNKCTSCSLDHLTAWQGYKKILDKYNTEILIVFRDPRENIIIETMKSMNMSFKCIFDKTGEFKKTNSVFRYMENNVFVMDKHKNVIFTDFPIKNEETWNRFIKRIKE
ncbi:MAG: hypothetical protein LBD59_08130 [Prevotellaceae bacterium]|jgi:hypothetical protein|nr:hypothetical protein [Prevotellaceae bacterium]